MFVESQYSTNCVVVQTGTAASTSNVHPLKYNLITLLTEWNSCLCRWLSHGPCCIKIPLNPSYGNSSWIYPVHSPCSDPLPTANFILCCHCIYLATLSCNTFTKLTLYPGINQSQTLFKSCEHCYFYLVLLPLAAESQKFFMLPWHKVYSCVLQKCRKYKEQAYSHPDVNCFDIRHLWREQRRRPNVNFTDVKFSISYQEEVH